MKFHGVCREKKIKSPLFFHCNWGHFWILNSEILVCIMEFYKVWRKKFTTVKKNQNQTMTIFLAVLIISDVSLRLWLHVRFSLYFSHFDFFWEKLHIFTLWVSSLWSFIMFERTAFEKRERQVHRRIRRQIQEKS